MIEHGAPRPPVKFLQQDATDATAPREKPRQPNNLVLAQQVLERLPEPDDLFKGQNVVITGASNGIGYSSALYLARGGASVTTMSTKGANAEFTAGTDLLGITDKVRILKGDLTNPDEHTAFLQHAIGRSKMHIDTLVLNASGRGPAINVDSNLRTVRTLLPYMRGGVIILEQSVARYHKKLVEEGGPDMDDESIHEYLRFVSPDKHKGEEELWGMMDEMGRLGVRLMVKVSPVVPNSKNVLLFRQRDHRNQVLGKGAGSIDDLQADVSTKLALPVYVEIDDMGFKTRELVASDLPTGHVELHAGPNMFDGPSLLRKHWKREYVWIDTFKLDDPANGDTRVLIPPKKTLSEWDLEHIVEQSVDAHIIAQSASDMDDRSLRHFSKDHNGKKPQVEGNALVVHTSLEKHGEEQYKASAKVYEFGSEDPLHSTHYTIHAATR